MNIQLQSPEGVGHDETTAARPIRMLHCVGHLLRGGIEKWLYQTLPPQLSSHCEHHVLVRTAEEEPFTKAFQQAGIPVWVCSNYANPFAYALEFRKLVAEKGPYDILHVHGSSFSGLLTLALAKLFGIKKVVVHSHNDTHPLLESRGPLYRAYCALTMQAYRSLADSGFAASVRAAESMFGRKWATDKRWELLYYGVDCKPFTRSADPGIRRRLDISPDAFVVGHVGRFHEQKNHNFLVEVVACAIALEPRTHCLLIGDGPLRGRVTAEIERRNLRQHFTFVPDTLAVADYMISAMDCFVFPSRYEGLGLVVVEAQAAGLPCLISDRVPAEAIVNSSLVNVLALEKPPSEWAQSVLRCKSASGEPHLSALNQVKNSRFDLERCISTLLARYSTLARQGGVHIGA
jgi:glycosyltransferase involved in cell wall biosynthesis